MLEISAERLELLRKSDPALFEEALGWLSELDEIKELDPLQLYVPHAKQAVFHGARSKIKAFLGGNQSGKTTAGIADDLIQAVDRECLPERLGPYKRFEPPFLCRIITPDFTSTMEGVIFHKLREWAPRGQLAGGSWEAAYDKSLRKLYFANGSVFDFLTFEQDLDKFGGATLDRVHFDEEPPGGKGRNIYLESRIRVMKRGGDLVFTMTPLMGMSWTFDEVYERRLQGDVTVVQVATDENPHLSRTELEETFSRMSGEEQKARREGRFVHFGGLVVDVDDDRHVVDGLTRRHVDDLEVYVVIDPGAAQGAVLWAGFDRDDVMWCFDELYPSGRQETLVESVASAIGEKNALWGLREPTYIIDPSARNRTVDGGDGVEAAFHTQGIFPMRGKNDRFASIMQLRRRAAADPPGIRISRDCPNFRWELGRWRVAEDESMVQERPKRGSGRNDSFATVGPDHLCD